jgi:hypothetical protein
VSEVSVPIFPPESSVNVALGAQCSVHARSLFEIYVNDVLDVGDVVAHNLQMSIELLNV